METKTHSLIEIAKPADADEALLVSFDLARQASLGDGEAERAALIIAEAAANILKHAGEGQMLIRAMQREAKPALEIIALDRGPGIAHLGAAMRGGYSTSGSAGVGLCAMSRASNLFDIYSHPGQGTALLAQVWARPLRRNTARDYVSSPVKSGAISTVKPGARISGDAWLAKHQPSRSLVMVANGLGHSAEAAGAVANAIKVMEEIHALSPAEIVEVVHETLRGTRGASVAVAEIRLSGIAPEVRFAGVGNIAARIVNGGKAQHLISLNGIAGYQAEIQEYTYHWSAHSALIVHTDGLFTQWDTGDYPGLSASHPALIAAVLHRDFNRGLDDATILVAKQ
ncbi:MAG: SpoIIE family protein phosphatase [Blastocatellales bacterium]